MTDPRKIVLVGAPRSGNRLIQAMLRRHGFLVEIRHYGSEQPFPSGVTRPHQAHWGTGFSPCSSHYRRAPTSWVPSTPPKALMWQVEQVNLGLVAHGLHIGQQVLTQVER